MLLESGVAVSVRLVLLAHPPGTSYSWQMRSITPEECDRWTRDRGVKLAQSYSHFLGEPAAESLRFAIPKKASVQIALSEALLEAIPGIAQSLLWMTDWPLYREHEMALLMRIRAGYGETRSLIEAPGHILEEADRSILAGLIFLMQAFAWDSSYVTSDARTILFTSHHELMEVLTRDGEFAAQIREIGTKFGLDLR
jgi:hypothetical protein